MPNLEFYKIDFEVICALSKFPFAPDTILPGMPDRDERNEAGPQRKKARAMVCSGGPQDLVRRAPSLSVREIVEPTPGQKMLAQAATMLNQERGDFELQMAQEKAKNKALKKEVDRAYQLLQVERSKHDSEICVKDKEIETLIKEKEHLKQGDLRDEYEKLKTQGAEKDEEICKQQQDIAAKRNKIRELTEALSNKRTQFTELEKMHANVKTQLDNEKKEHSELKAGRVQDIQKMAQQDELIKQMKEKLVEWEFQVACCKDELQKMGCLAQNLKNKTISYSRELDKILPKNDARGNALGRRDCIHDFRRVFSPTGKMVGNHGMPLEYTPELWEQVKGLPDDPLPNDTAEKVAARRLSFCTYIKNAESEHF